MPCVRWALRWLRLWEITKPRLGQEVGSHGGFRFRDEEKGAECTHFLVSEDTSKSWQSQAKKRAVSRTWACCTLLSHVHPSRAGKWVCCLSSPAHGIRQPELTETWKNMAAYSSIHSSVRWDKIVTAVAVTVYNKWPQIKQHKLILFWESRVWAERTCLADLFSTRSETSAKKTLIPLAWNHCLCVWSLIWGNSHWNWE